MPANAGIQVTDSVRHTVGKRYPGHGAGPGFSPGWTKNAWIPAGVYPESGESISSQEIATMSERHIDARSRLHNPL
jgi:hypothetical protein